MDERRRPQQGGGSKPPPVPGISHAEAAQLRSRIDKLEKVIAEHFAEKNQWNSLIREWVGSVVHIELMHGESITGELMWVDRYTMCLTEAGRPAIVHKGAIAVIRREGQVSAVQ